VIRRHHGNIRLSSQKKSQQRCLKEVHHTIHRRVFSVLDLYPVLLPAASIGSVTVLRNQALQSKLARLPKQVRARSLPVQTHLRRCPRVGVPKGGQDWPYAWKEADPVDRRRPLRGCRAKLDFLVVFAGVQRIEIGDAINSPPRRR